MVRSYAAELPTTPVRANIFNPGRLRTAHARPGVPGDDPEDFRPPSVAAPKLIDMIEPGYSRERNAVRLSQRARRGPL